ncbi:hypothetical protein L210DRAFT_3639982 [Boletus edulis BED1]|uniref:Uncharacterized protein n=1 Tax=Boletus edulis BED1 TaxID=1328754 RepID=A0AAD4C7I5_BOLED|nr:hypothetical protein L210DRAFT_3639982 [Boletus edulis BED1]
MSPIPSIATTFALPTAAPSVTLHPDSTGQGIPLMSQHLLATGSFLVAVVLVLVARYFHHGRGAVNHTRTSNTWKPLTSLLSRIRRRGSPTDWPIDVEVGFELDVRIVYVPRFSHPAIWNLVETPSVPDLSPPGVDSFLGMVDRVGRHGVKEVPLYDTSSPTSVNFGSEITGTTVRQGTFLSVLGEPENYPSETAPSNPELDFPGAPCDGISTVDSELDLGCSPCDAISTTDSGWHLACSPDEGIVVTRPRSSYGPCTRRHGVVDMTHFAQSLKDTIPEEGYPLVPAIPRRAGLLDLSSFVEMDLTPPCGSLQELDPADEESTTVNCDIGVHATEALVDGSDDVNIPGAPHSGGDLMRLRDPDLDCTPLSLSEDSDPECSSDDDEDGAYPAPPLFLRNGRRSSLESTFTPGTDSEVFDEGPIYPSTPHPSLPLLGLGLTFTRSPYRHQIWAPIFRCQSRDTSALARSTVRYSMVRRSFWRAEIACEIAIPRPYPL